MDLTERGAARGDTARRHPWEVRRFEAYRRILADHGALAAGRVLDVGAGDGWFSASLQPALPADAEIVCWDVNYDDNDLEPGGRGLVRTREVPPPGFDLVLALDVLEHVEEPGRLIAEVLRPLTEPGTPVLVAVPAHQRLFGSHDVILGHHRRYGRRELLDQVAPWIDVHEHGSLFSTLLLPRALTVAGERAFGDETTRRSEPSDAAGHGVGAWSGGRVTTAIVGAVLAADARLGRALTRRGVPVPGLSLWVYGETR